MIDQFFKKNRSDRFDEIDLWVWTLKGEFFVSHEEMNGADKLVFTFWEMNSSSLDSMNDACLENYEISAFDHFIYRNTMQIKKFYLRYMFRSWNLDESMTWRDDGGLDDESFEKILHLHPKIVSELFNNLDECLEKMDDDDETIIKQAHLLFGKNGSVSNPHKMISLYCNLCDMWTKFGLNYFDLKRMPLSERMSLQKIISIEKQIQSQEFKQKELQSKAQSHSRGRR